MSTATTTSPLIEDTLPPLPHSQFRIPHSPKSFHTFRTALTSASTNLDDILTTLDLSQEETQQLLASHNYHAHRQLRTHLLAQQLQLAAQDHAQHALSTLIKLTDSTHPAIARLAATHPLSTLKNPQSKIKTQKPKIPHCSLRSPLLP